LDILEAARMEKSGRVTIRLITLAKIRR